MHILCLIEKYLINTRYGIHRKTEPSTAESSQYYVPNSYA